jgi:hypothetical protein
MLLSILRRTPRRRKREREEKGDEEEFDWNLLSVRKLFFALCGIQQRYNTSESLLGGSGHCFLYWRGYVFRNGPFASACSPTVQTSLCKAASVNTALIFCTATGKVPAHNANTHVIRSGLCVEVWAIIKTRPG